MIADGKVSLSAWIEEGWDDENDYETEEYKYYEKVVVRDLKGNMLAENLGGFYSNIDLGIVKYHFEAVTGHDIK